MKNCIKCQNKIPNRIKIGNRFRNLQNRKYCITCSPIDKHNTKKIHLISKSSNIKYCNNCSKEFKTKGSLCYTCNFNKRQNRTRKIIISLVGTQCYICGYDKQNFKLIDMHHIKDKSFSLNMREILRHSWKDVVEEIKKCLPVCANCHREIHQNMVEASIIETSCHLFSMEYNAKYKKLIA